MGEEEHALASGLVCFANSPPIFEGNQGEDFENWEARFSVWAEVHAPGNKLRIFPTLLGEAAFSVYRELTAAQKQSYTEIETAFKHAYSNADFVDAFRAELTNRNRKESENLAVYVGELRKLVRRAYPKYNDEAREDVILTRFLSGIGETGRKVRNKEPKTVKEALDKASKLECRKELDKESISMVHTDKENVKVEPSMEFQAMQQQLEQLQHQIASLTATSSRNSNVRCYNCNNFGHMARDCKVANRRLFYMSVDRPDT
jgi:hypothetical protein